MTGKEMACVVEALELGGWQTVTPPGEDKFHLGPTNEVFDGLIKASFEHPNSEETLTLSMPYRYLEEFLEERKSDAD